MEFAFAFALTLSGLVVLSCVLAFLLGAGWAGVVLALLAPVALYIADKVVTKDSLMAILYVGAFLLPFIGAAIGLGLMAGWVLRQRSNWTGGLLIASLLAYIWGYYGVITAKTERAEREAKRDLAAAVEYVDNHPQLLALVHAPIRAERTATINYFEPPHERYEFRIGRHVPPYYAIVDVRRAGESATATLACVTTLASGERDIKVETCAQAPVALPPPATAPK